MKILVLGGAGMIGHRMWSTLSVLGHEVYGTVRSDRSNEQLCKFSGIHKSNIIHYKDISEFDRLKNIIQELQPDWVLNCIGIVKQLKLSQSYIPTLKTNALFPHELAEICSACGTRILQFSTDCVFSGKMGMYCEEDITDANDLYGRSKVLGEIDYLDNVLTIRTSTIGREITPHGGLLEWFLSNRGKKVLGYSNAIYSGFPTHSLAKIIDEYILDNSLYGTYHISTKPIDKCSLLNNIKIIKKLDIQIKEEIDFIIDRSLNCNKFVNTTGFVQHHFDHYLGDLLIDWDIYEEMHKVK